MKRGDRITYVDSHGKHHAATVTGVPDTGASGFKMVDLEYGDYKVEAAPHAHDREKGKGFWLLATETEVPPERRAPDEQQPIALARAEASGGLPPATRRATPAKKKATRKS